MISSFFAPKAKKANKAPLSSPATGGGSKRTQHAVTPSPGEPTVTGSEDAGATDGNKRHKPTPSLPTEVEDLLSNLADHAENETGCAVGRATWRTALERHTLGCSFASLARFVSAERNKAGNTVYPPPCDTFSALNLTPLDKVKVVIVGQDPYHGPNQGHGLAFSVRKGVAIPPSLRNIYKELKNDPDLPFPAPGVGGPNGGGNGEGAPMPKHGNLQRWAAQGVLLLNAVLTVRRSQPNSHSKKGWEAFTDEIIRIVDRESKRREEEGSKGGLVFLLWGKPASKKAEAVISQIKGRHTVICTSHPSPLGASKTASPFLGSRCFSRANEALRGKGLDPIDWAVDCDAVDSAGHPMV